MIALLAPLPKAFIDKHKPLDAAGQVQEQDAWGEALFSRSIRSRVQACIHLQQLWSFLLYLKEIKSLKGNFRLLGSAVIW